MVDIHLSQIRHRSCLLLLFACWPLTLLAAEQEAAEVEPMKHVYATAGGVELHAYVFSPQTDEPRPRPAIVVFHGGGWTIGEAEWAFSRARHFAELGMVGVAAQYRLSDQKDVTPLEAMADARAVIRWMRSNAADLGIDPERVAAYGWSAGAHLAASAAIFSDQSQNSTKGSLSADCVPNALLLFSPAVSVADSTWVQKLLGERAEAKEISPREHVRPGLPPTIILQGRTDTVTPTPGVVAFCENLRKAGNRCQLKIYEGVGHLFTPSTEPDDGWPNADPEVRDAAYGAADRFLRSLGFLE